MKLEHKAEENFFLAAAAVENDFGLRVESASSQKQQKQKHIKHLDLVFKALQCASMRLWTRNSWQKKSVNSELRILQYNITAL